MPTTKLKNIAYQFILPFISPNCNTRAITCVIGHPVMNLGIAEKLYHRFHILGSATLLSSGDDASIILTSSSDPHHEAYADTYFRVASITKMATSVLTMHLAENHVLDLNTPVSTYFSSDALPECFNRISLIQLLSHTSGLIDPPDLESSLNKGLPFPKLISQSHCFSSDGKFHYSNLGFGIIGCILESVIEKPIGQIFDELLFIPQKMNATLEGCKLTKEKIMPVTRILPYHRDSDMILTDLGSKPLLYPDPMRHYGHTAGSMYADIAAIHKLLKLISESNRYLSDDTISAVKKEHASYGKISPSLSYGLGLLRICDPYISDHMIYGHQGFAYGCADGAFWEEQTGRIMITLNGGCSEARIGRLGTANRSFLHFAFRKELPTW